MSMRAIRDELREARENRGERRDRRVQAHATGVAPFAIVGDDVYAVVESGSDRIAADVEDAVRLARPLALASLREREVDLHPSVRSAALSGASGAARRTRQLKTQLTSISNATKGVWTGLDQLARRS